MREQPSPLRSWTDFRRIPRAVRPASYWPSDQLLAQRPRPRYEGPRKLKHENPNYTTRGRWITPTSPRDSKREGVKRKEE